MCLSRSWFQIPVATEVDFLPHPVEFHVEAAGVADRLALCVSSPQGGRGGVTVGAGQAYPPGGRLQRGQQKKKDLTKTSLLRGIYHPRKPAGATISRLII